MDMHALSNNTAHNSNNAMAMSNALKLKMNQRQIYPDLAAYSVYVFIWVHKRLKIAV